MMFLIALISFMGLFAKQMPAPAGQSQDQELTWAASAQAVEPCLPLSRCVSTELDQKWSGQGSDKHSGRKCGHPKR